jgi:hypothetical protein
MSETPSQNFNNSNIRAFSQNFKILTFFSKSVSVSFSILSLFGVNCSDISLDCMKLSSNILGSILNYLFSFHFFFYVFYDIPRDVYLDSLLRQGSSKDNNAPFAGSFSSDLEKSISDRFHDNNGPIS